MKKNKLLNKKNVEFSPSDKICDSLEGHEMKLRIDWLSIVSRFHSEEEKSEFVQKLQSLPEEISPERNGDMSPLQVWFVHFT